MGSVDDGERTAGQYDGMAIAYAADNTTSAFNAFYERPGTVSLLGDVKGLRVLEVGCGAGPLTAWLVEHGAVVTAMDISPVMLDLAEHALADRATFVVADLARPLSFATTAAFDLVVGSLVLHYIRAWETPLRELRRVLKPDGAVVFSTHHPAMDWQLHSAEDYFAIRQITETWSRGGRDFEVTFWRRPLTAMTEAIASAGFVIEHLVEPMPRADLADRDPAAFELLSTQPRFLFFRLRPA